MYNKLKSIIKNIIVWCKKKTINFMNLIRDENSRDIFLIMLPSIPIIIELIVSIFTINEEYYIFVIQFTLYILIFCLIIFFTKQIIIKGQTYIFNLFLCIVCLYFIAYTLSSYVNINLTETIEVILSIFFIVELLLFLFLSFNEQYFKKKFKKRILINEKLILVIVCIMIGAGVSMDLNEIVSIYLLFVIIFSSIIIWLYSLNAYVVYHNSNVNINFLNFKYSDVAAKKIYLNEYSIKHLTDVRIFKLNLYTFFPKNSINHSLTVLNHGYIQIKGNVDKAKDYIYYAIDKKHDGDYVRIKFLIEYNAEKDANTSIFEQSLSKKAEIFDLYIKLECIDNELILTKQRIFNYHRAFLYHKILKFWIYDRKIDTKDCPLENLFYRSYTYNSELDITEECKILKDSKIIDKRKWLLHEGTFGCGKSTLDVLAVSNTGCIPVVISPWEENFDIDILALIFKRVAKVSKKRLYSYDSSISIFTVVAIAGFFYCIQRLFLYFIDKIPIYLLDNLYVKAYTILGAIMNATICEIFLDMIVEIACVGIALFLAFRILPKAIIYMKNSTKVHQDYYIKNIVKMLELENIIMIIEDMDRLNSEVAENVFRTLSAINRQCAKHHKIIGLLSFHITSRTKQGNDSSIEISSDATEPANSNKKILQTNTVLENLENKVIYKRIFGKYDDYTSKKEYIKNLVYILIILYVEQGESIDSLEILEIKYADLFEKVNNLNLKKTNFRDIRKIIEDFAKEKKWNDFTILLERLEKNDSAA